MGLLCFVAVFSFPCVGIENPDKQFFFFFFKAFRNQGFARFCLRLSWWLSWNVQMYFFPSGTVKVICRGRSKHLTAIKKRLLWGAWASVTPLVTLVPLVTCGGFLPGFPLTPWWRCWVVRLSCVKSFCSVFITCVLWYEIDFWNNITFAFPIGTKEGEKLWACNNVKPGFLNHFVLQLLSKHRRWWGYTRLLFLF